MSEENEHGDHDDHDHEGDDHDHEGHDHDHDHEGHGSERHGHDHALIVDRLPAGHWQIDPNGSEVLFKTRTLFGLLPVNGLFERFGGELVVDESGAAHGRLVVETASINSGIGRRDADLRSPSYFGSDEFPEMTFTLDRFEPSGEQHMNVTGSLQIRQASIPLTLPVHAITHGDHLHLEGRVIVDHDAAGLGWAKPGRVGKRVRAEAALTLNRAG